VPHRGVVAYVFASLLSFPSRHRDAQGLLDHFTNHLRTLALIQDQETALRSIATFPGIGSSGTANRSQPGAPQRAYRALLSGTQGGHGTTTRLPLAVIPASLVSELRRAGTVR